MKNIKTVFVFILVGSLILSYLYYIQPKHNEEKINFNYKIVGPAYLCDENNYYFKIDGNYYSMKDNNCKISDYNFCEIYINNYHFYCLCKKGNKFSLIREKDYCLFTYQ
jgi:hypothetical protein